ncbi:uncharacterized membrane protein (UPF0127 family) [Natronocella acetinitrilica]|uniref:Uncharacterized membrane protein (UPF0127 family) n=1 Tax=Natronocella acetinitrilica TaxID=414046 RepID=A0AAE3G1J5_9GAMM|nr:DUF192 domain-containing protein [Natronocella acetinitrilica]MCP1674110.1 uncharacterized membrane protein (UPF0127 family) [Natronocella acetinitrilica]
MGVTGKTVMGQIRRMALATALLFGGAGSVLAACLPSTPALESMPRAALLLHPPGEAVEPIALDARLAITDTQRMAGMQRLCPEVVLENPMLFVFEQPIAAAFHMRNVHGPLVIGFIDADGIIFQVEHMHPGDAPVHARAPILFALEIHPAHPLGALRPGQRIALAD